MTFHTFECKYPLSGSKFATIHKELKNLGSSYFENKPKMADENKKTEKITKYVCTALSQYGIIIYIILRETTSSTFVPMLIYRINPTRMIEENKDNYVDVFHCNNALDIPQMANRLLNEISPNLPNIEICSLSRFDYCVNIKLESQQQVTDSIKLINQAFDPTSGYTQKIMFHTKSYKPKYPKTEATFLKSKRVEISFYNKRLHLQQEDLKDEWHDDILRAEFRCFKSYINDLYKRFDIDNITDFFEKSIEIGNYVIAYQLKKLKLDVMFRSSKSIENIIKNGTFKAKTKLDMLLLVEWVSSHKSLKRVIDTCSKSIVNKKLLKKFHKLGISVKPLPCRSSLPEPFNLSELIYKFADAKKV